MASHGAFLQGKHRNTLQLGYNILIKDIERTLQLAATGSEEELRLLVHHPLPKVISRLLINENLTEELAIIIANRKNLGAESLEALYNDSRWKESYRVMLSLCKNRKNTAENLPFYNKIVTGIGHY